MQVELEKEIKVVSSPSMSVLSSTSSDAASITGLDIAIPASSSAGARSPQASAPNNSPIMSMIRERDQTIHHLKMALESSRRRAASLEENLASIKTRGKFKAGAQHKDGSSVQVQDVIAQSTLHFKQYQQIRKNYHDLLSRRTKALSQSSGATSEAKVVVTELQTRLIKEMEEREAEAAIYNARLYENEKRQGDWYVEKRLMERQMQQMADELKERDRVDGEIENCVASLFERIEALEKDNAHLRGHLQS
mmetsp:Transcript_19839/g.55161  ORF Transcript_19839/g.55161 Transcript_19839/m.55161 type:complete len:250 (-) Transcript_19839:321-1070(-)